MTTVACVIARQLKSAGVRYAMGHPGGEVIDLLEGLRLEGIEVILTHHEASAGFMADAIASFDRAPAVCFGTLGPGATNLITGVAQAFLDRSPVIALTGQMPMDRYENATHQKLDLGALFGPITKWHARVNTQNAPAVIARALRVATSERPGPVYLEVPSDVARQEVAGRIGRLADDAPVASHIDRARALNPEAGRAAASHLRTCARPVIVAGLDAQRARAVAELRTLAERWQMPVIVTPKAKGLFPEDHPLFLGVIDMLGMDRLFSYIEERDLVIAAGLDPVELAHPWKAAARLIHLGPFPNDDQFFASDADIVAPVPDAIVTLLDRAGEPVAKYEVEEVRAFRTSFWTHVNPSRRSLTPQEVMTELRHALPSDAIVSCDVGNNKSLAGQCFPVYAPDTFAVSNGLSSMGYGLPAAIGLQLRERERRVACVLGDGGITMLLGEIETAVRLRLPILIVVLADGALSQIKIGQERRGYPPTATTFGRIDYVALAKAFGARAVEVRTRDECRKAFSDLPDQMPVIVAAYIDPSAYRLEQ